MARGPSHSVSRVARWYKGYRTATTCELHECFSTRRRVWARTERTFCHRRVATTPTTLSSASSRSSSQKSRGQAALGCTTDVCVSTSTELGTQSTLRSRAGACRTIKASKDVLGTAFALRAGGTQWKTTRTAFIARPCCGVSRATNFWSTASRG